MKQILIASDHAGYLLKSHLIGHLTHAGHTCLDLGTDSTDAVDYPDFAHAVCYAIAHYPDAYGILICGTGTGMAIAANRHTDIRCAPCTTPEMARLARRHNNANI